MGGFHLVGGLEGFRLGHMSVADGAPDSGPVIAILARQIGQGFAHFGGVELRHRIGLAVGAQLDFGLQLLKGARRRELGEGVGGRQQGGGERAGDGDPAGDLHGFLPFLF